jgi:hypothetical protein
MSDDSNRRTFERAPLFAAVGIDTPERKDRAGITRNVSAGGLLFHSMSRFTLGERMLLTYRDPATRQDSQVPARVVRVASDLPMTGNSFPHLCAVEFEHPIEITA